ncbi:SulA-like leucine-rich domain-containing protein [Pseudoalteromonas phenolica]|nr:SulA-like leucine-rich domain-containing protein [Pseudoalteromonas phenolica]
MLQTTAVLPSSVKKVDAVKAINFVETPDEVCASLELLKIIHQCNNKQGWTLLIAPDHIPNKDMLEASSIDSSKLLVIRKKHIVDLEYVLNSALNNGNFAAVITWTGITDPEQLSQMHLSQTDISLYCFTETCSKVCTIERIAS